MTFSARTIKIYLGFSLVFFFCGFIGRHIYWTLNPDIHFQKGDCLYIEDQREKEKESWEKTNNYPTIYHQVSEVGKKNYHIHMLYDGQILKSSDGQTINFSLAHKVFTKTTCPEVNNSKKTY